MNTVNHNVQDKKPPTSKANKNNFRQLHGMLLLDKPTGISSNYALQRARRAYYAKKAGHTGSLDPLASGLLPVCFGDYTKFCDNLLLAQKRYEVGVRLGVRTDSGDAEGNIIETSDAINISYELVDLILDKFRCGYQQMPPMYSALKQNGKPLYELARQGKVVERKRRAVSFKHIVINSLFRGYLQLDVICSKGTYIRSLVDDLGQALGCGAHVTVLRRTEVGSFNIKNMVTLAGVELLSNDKNFKSLDALLVPLHHMFANLPQLTLADKEVHRLRQGQRLSAESIVPGIIGKISLFNKDGLWLGLLEATEAGRLQVVKIISSGSKF